jgi:outer membrane protein TolC
LLLGPPVLAIADDASANAECACATRFQPLTLTDAVTQALRNEPRLLLARQDVEESKADITAAVTPFLPKGQILLDDERFVPNHPFEAVTVVGNNILGGTKTYSGYGAISVSWNISDRLLKTAKPHDANRAEPTSPLLRRAMRG